MGKRKWSGREQFATSFTGSLLGPRVLLQRVREDRVKGLGTRLNNLSISTTSAKKNHGNEQRKVVYFWYYCNKEPRSLTAGFSNNLSRSSSFYLKAGITKNPSNTAPWQNSQKKMSRNIWKVAYCTFICCSNSIAIFCFSILSASSASLNCFNIDSYYSNENIILNNIQKLINNSQR